MGIVCSGEPVPEDPRLSYHARHWETGMMNSWYQNCPGFLLSLVCPCCFAMYLRYKALNENMTRYRCCQGYFCPECTTYCDQSAPSCPWVCLALEATLCESCAISATRIFVQDERQIVTDPCDNRIMRFNNMVQILACICSLLAIFIAELREGSRLLHNFAQLVYLLTQACMQAQTHLELKKHPTAASYGVISAQPAMQPPPIKPSEQHPQYPQYPPSAVTSQPSPYAHYGSNAPPGYPTGYPTGYPASASYQGSQPRETGI